MDDFDNDSFIADDDGLEDDRFDEALFTPRDLPQPPPEASGSIQNDGGDPQAGGSTAKRTIDTDAPLEPDDERDPQQPMTPEVVHPIATQPSDPTQQQRVEAISFSAVFAGEQDDCMQHDESERARSSQRATTTSQEFGVDCDEDSETSLGPHCQNDDRTTVCEVELRQPAHSQRERPHSAITPKARPLSGCSTSANRDCRSRPRSATCGNKKARQIHGMMTRDPRTWTRKNKIIEFGRNASLTPSTNEVCAAAYEVCDWIESINLAQYRNKFAHNCIDGELLLELTDAHLKYDLGIGPLGHRYALKKAIQHLTMQCSQQNGGRNGVSRQRPQSAPLDRPRRPASASSKVIPPDSHLGPAHGKITVYEQRSKLMFEMDRAQARAAHKHTIAWNMLRNAQIDEDEVKRLCGEIAHLESFHKIELSGRYGVLDTEARIPWHPTGDKTDTKDPFPERIGKSRDHPRVEETFAPRLNKTSMAIMNEGMNQGHPVPFMDRLRRDLQERKSRNRRKSSYLEESEGYPATKKRDFALVAKFFASKFGTELPEDAKEAIEMVHDTVEQYPDQLGLYDVQVQRILKKQGMQKVSAVASAVRTLQFMERYRNEMKTRDARSRDLMKKWYSQSPSGSGYKDKWQFDLEQCQLYFARLGWTESSSEDSISDDRLDSLLKRAKHYKDAKERNKEGDIDWGTFSADGLSELQSRRHEKEIRELEREARRSAEAQKPSAVDQALGEKIPDALATIDPSKMPKDWLLYTVKLVSGSLADDIFKLQSLKGVKKQVAVYRKIRTLKFLEFTAEDLVERNRKTDEMYAALAPERKIITKEQADNFFQRLMEDGIRRREKRERMISEKKNKEEELARQLAMKTSPTQRKRPASARSRR